MKKIEKLRKKINDSLYDHLGLKISLDYIKTTIYCVFAGFIFAFGFISFISPTGDDISIVTGGVSGISQIIYLVISFFNHDITLSDVTSISYFVLNVPILLFAFFKIGKKFAIFTFINVLISSVFIRIFPSFLQPIKDLLVSGGEYGGIVTRILFGGLCVGLSSALAFRVNTSCGGIDVVSYYFSLRKSTQVGKYNVLINIFIALLYSILTLVKSPNEWAKSLLILFFSLLYHFIVALVIDFINVRNKKVQLQIITKNIHMNKVLIANFPHSSTYIMGKGSYSGDDKMIIYTVISSSEINNVVKLCKRVDSHAFIAVTPLSQVYGNFFIKPVD